MKKTIAVILVMISTLSCFSMNAFSYNTLKSTYYAKDTSKSYVVSQRILESSDSKETMNYTYDSNGKLIKETKQEDGAVTTYSYDKKGNLTEEKYNSYPISQYDKYTYNSNNKLIKHHVEGLGGTYDTVYKYDSKGRLVKDDQGRKYTYDSKGNLKKYTNNGLETTECSYNSKNQLIKKTRKSSDGYSSVVSYTYDSKGRLKSEKINSSFEGSYTKEYTYNSKDRLQKAVTKTAEYGTVQTVTYSYNSKGLLTKWVSKYPGQKGYSQKCVFKYKKLNAPVFKADEIKLSKYDYTYNGKAKKPAVFIDNTIGFHDAFSKGVNYTVSYSNNVEPGKAKIKITFINPDDEEYFGKTVTIFFNIKPRQVSGLKAKTVKKNSVQLTWTKLKEAKYYKVMKRIDGKSWVPIGTVSTNSITVKDLKAGTKYKFCVKAIDSTKKVGGKLSSSISVTTKK